MALLLFTTIAGTATAATGGFDITIPIDTVVRAPEGSITELATVDVPGEAVGQQCSVEARGTNQPSVHPDNDLVVQSGDSQVVLPNVESVAGGTVVGGNPLTLGNTVSVSLEMGPDEVFSGGFDIILDCDPVPGRIIVVKEVTEGSDTAQAFEFATSYSEGFSLSDGEQNDSGELTPGTYTVAETVPAGWTLESATCDDQSPIDAVALDPGETITCTFVNDQVPPEPGQIIVEKEVTEGSETTQTFEFTTSYGSGGFALADGEQNVSGDLAPGTYSVEESVPAGWTLESAVCDDGSPIDAIELSEGETVTCTFTNGQIEDEVEAAIEVTVDSVCEVVDDEGVGFIDVNVSVDNGATVVVRDSNGDVVDTLTSDGTVEVPEGATYTWEATPSEGFEFPEGAASSGSVTIETCSEPETLPFTGPETEGLVVLATVLFGAGSTLLLATRKRGSQTSH